MSVLAARCVTVPWHELPRWDLKTARASRFRMAHTSYLPLGDFVEEATELVHPRREPGVDWPIYGVNNKEGIYFSHHQLGSNFNSAYKRIRKDWFFHNPTRANVGSIGRVPEVPDNAITSPEYQVWRIRERLLPDFVEILIRTRTFLDLVACHRVGAVKERLFTQNLLEIPIPPLSLKQQSEVVTIWRCQQEKIWRLSNEAEEGIAVLERKILNALKIQTPSLEPKPRAYSFQWSSLERWGAMFNRWSWTVDDLLRSDLPSQRLEDIALINPSLPEKANKMGQVSFVEMEAVDHVSGEIIGRIDRPYTEVANGYTRFINGDVIWAKITPCMQNGKSAVAQNLTNGVGCGSTEFHVVRLTDKKKTLARYLWLILRLPYVREAAKRYFIGSAGQQRVPDDFLRHIRIPVPNLAKQKKVSDLYLGCLSDSIEKLSSADKMEVAMMGNLDVRIFS